jgi:hypothetical protein
MTSHSVDFKGNRMSNLSSGEREAIWTGIIIGEVALAIGLGAWHESFAAPFITIAISCLVDVILVYKNWIK